MKIKINVIKYLCLLLFLFSNGIPQTKEIPDDELKKGIDYIYNIKFDSAEVYFKKIIARYPSNPEGRFFLAMIEWWRIALNYNDESKDNRFFEMLEDVIFHCDKVLKKYPNDFNALFFKGGALGFRGRLRAVRESWIKAAEDGRLAFPIVQLAGKIRPDNYDVLFGTGLYNYYAVVVPEKVPLLKPLMLFFPAGNKELGIKQLKEAAEKGKFASTETKYFLLSLYYDVEGDYKQALYYAQDLHKLYPDNPTFHKYIGRTYTRMGDYTKAAEVYSDILIKVKAGYPGYNEYLEREAYYYIGTQHRYYGSLDSAKAAFLKSIEISKKLDTPGEESGFQASAWLTLGNILDLLKDRKEAIEAYNRVLSIKEFNKSHSLAKRYLEKSYGE